MSYEICLIKSKLSVLTEKEWNCNVPHLLTFVPLLILYRYLLHVLCGQLGHCILRGEAGPWNQRKDTRGDPRLSKHQKIKMNLLHTTEVFQDGKWEFTGHNRIILRWKMMSTFTFPTFTVCSTVRLLLIEETIQFSPPPASPPLLSCSPPCNM